jgi:hypothetical protein
MSDELRQSLRRKEKNMQDLADVRLAEIHERFPSLLVAADRMANEILGPQSWLMRRGSGDHWLDQPTFKDWCQDPRGVVVAETTPKQITMADDAGCHLELLRGSITMPRAAGDPRAENVSHVHGAESSWMLVYAPSLREA